MQNYQVVPRGQPFIRHSLSLPHSLSACYTLASRHGLGTLPLAPSPVPVPHLSHCRYLHDLHRFDFNHNHWTSITTTSVPPCPRAGAGMVAWNGTLVLFGGRGASNQFLDDLVSFDLGTSSWWLLQDTGKKPACRWNHVAVELGGFLYIMGGSRRRSHGIVIRHNDCRKVRLQDLLRTSIPVPPVASLDSNAAPSVLPDPEEVDATVQARADKLTSGFAPLNRPMPGHVPGTLPTDSCVPTHNSVDCSVEGPQSTADVELRLAEKMSEIQHYKHCIAVAEARIQEWQAKLQQAEAWVQGHNAPVDSLAQAASSTGREERQREGIRRPERTSPMGETEGARASRQWKDSTKEEWGNATKEEWDDAEWTGVEGDAQWDGGGGSQWYAVHDSQWAGPHDGAPGKWDTVDWQTAHGSRSRGEVDAAGYWLGGEDAIKHPGRVGADAGGGRAGVSAVAGGKGWGRGQGKPRYETSQHFGPASRGFHWNDAGWERSRSQPTSRSGRGNGAPVDRRWPQPPHGPWGKSPGAWSESDASSWWYSGGRGAG